MIVIQTSVDRRAMTALARVNRKTFRRGRSGPVRLLAWFVVFLETFLTAVYIRGGQSGWLTNVLLAAIMLAAILGEDWANGLVGLRDLPANRREVNAAFRDESCYVCRTQAGEDWWPYKQIMAAAETKDYFVLFLDRRHGQIYDKKGFSRGTPAEFRSLIQKKTGHKPQFIR